MKQGQKRIYFLDELRGLAIICMVIHHTFYDIGFVMGYDIGYKIFDFLCVFQPFFWSVFIGVSGICSRFSRNTVKRGIILSLIGLGITFVTAFVMPKMGITGAEIYFGVISCLGMCMIITGLLMPLIKKMNPAFGMVLNVILFACLYGVSNHKIFFGLVTLPDRLYLTNFFMPLGFYNNLFHSADYFALIPWLFMFLFGAFLGGLALKGKFPKFMYKKHSRFFCFFGRNSLWVYLLHQPVLFAIMLPLSALLN